MKFAIAVVVAALLCTSVHAQTNPLNRTPEQQAKYEAALRQSPAANAAAQQAGNSLKTQYVARCVAKFQGPPRTYGQVMEQTGLCARQYDVARKNGTLPRGEFWMRAAPAGQWTARQKADAAVAVEKRRHDEFLANCTGGRGQCELKYRASIVPGGPTTSAKPPREP